MNHIDETDTYTLECMCTNPAPPPQALWGNNYDCIYHISKGAGRIKLMCEILCSNPTGGVLVPPQLLSANISVPGDDECVVTVEWSEPVISCGGSVSQYVLSVTPPTPDYQPGSEFRTNETQSNLTVSVDVTYTLTVRVNDSCGNSRTGQPMDIGPRGTLPVCT